MNLFIYFSCWLSEQADTTFILSRSGSIFQPWHTLFPFCSPALLQSMNRFIHTTVIFSALLRMAVIPRDVRTCMCVFSALLAFFLLLLSHDRLTAVSSAGCHRIIEVFLGLASNTFLFLQAGYCTVPSCYFLQRGKLLLRSARGRSAPKHIFGLLSCSNLSEYWTSLFHLNKQYSKKSNYSSSCQCGKQSY